ncbi:DEAD/DEAH box helicase family protein [Roseibacillus persicicus]|uniref:DEAD/DEAH box helicase family protein n=1 Tax=Roseibacillus persicicus TaxID=454148 RepID=UPI00280FAE41|nr:DEAD/DEAH box helicase family protein [Roseibacillus persicicus]MDQ8191294.1 DEAD/DEAH box helicase family protein [Roseibacillus persicicus]
MAVISSNFAFLDAEFSDLAKAARAAEKAIYPDPHAACFHCRRTLEFVVHWLYQAEKTLRLPYEQSLGALLHEPTFQKLLPERIFAKARLLQKWGNEAVHGKRPVYQITALQALEELHHILYWLARTYTRRGAQALDGISFDKALVPFPQATASSADKVALKKQEEELEQKTKKLSELDELVAAKDTELETLRAELAAAKAANEAVPDSHDYSEAETRTHLIDVELVRCGWDPKGPKVAEYEVKGMPNKHGCGFVDYVLWDDDGKPLAVVEAKRTTADPKQGRQQAKLYADCLEAEFGQRPLIFYTNGYVTWFWDDTNYPPRRVAGFYKKDELKRLVLRRETEQEIGQGRAKINDDIAGRYYQKRAIAHICNLLEERRRKALLVMATGTGKTRTAIALTDVLQRHNWAKSVLFLADRVSLVNQATNAFKAHLPEASPVNLVTEKDKSGRVYTCTYPTMMGLIDSHKNGEARFSPGHFDLIIIDEAHRSVYQTYGAIFEYFDSFLIGLTATPREEVDKNTYELFDLEPGVPTDAYELETAVSDEYLVPPRVKSVSMRFPREGITYDKLSDAEKAEWDELEWGDRDEVRRQRRVNAPAINNWLFNTDTADKVIEILMTEGHKVEEGDRLAKTIIFARNHKHAEFIEERFNYHYPAKKGHFARIIDNQAKYPQSLIDDFSEADREPHIAISVDMLDTGIDVPEVANLVFFKPVYSKIKFWQMIGRGTRLCPDLFGTGQAKQDFRVFDFCGNFEFFAENPDGLASSGGESLGTRLFKQRVALMQRLEGEAAEGREQTFSGVRAILREQIESMNLENFQVRLKREQVEAFQAKSTWEEDVFTDEQYRVLLNDLASLPDEMPSDTLEARCFDATVLSAQIAKVSGEDSKFKSLANTLTEVASELEEKKNVPVVAAELDLILAMQESEFWTGTTLDELEEVRTRLRGLIHLIEKGHKPPVYTGFVDEVTGVREGEPVAIPTMTGPQYEKKVRASLLGNLERLEIQKLRQGRPLTTQDIAELEKMLVSLGEEKGQELLEGLLARNAALSLPHFIRSCVGMDRRAVQERFSSFLSERSLNPAQIRFIELIIDQLTATGVLEPENLYEQPFLSLHAQGPEALFAGTNVLDRIFSKVEEFTKVEAS